MAAIEVYLEPSTADSYTDWVLRGQNLYSNPSYESASGTVELRRNLAINGALTTAATGWTTIPGTGGVATGARNNASTGQGWWTNIYRAAWTTGTTSPSGGVAAPPAAISPSTQYTASLQVLPSINNQSLVVSMEWRDAGNVLLSTTSSGTIPNASNSLRRLSVTGTSPATAATVTVTVTAAATGVNWAAGNSLSVGALLIEAGSQSLPYFDGTRRPPVRTNLQTRPRGSNWGDIAWGTGGDGTYGPVSDSRFSNSEAVMVQWTTAPTATGFTMAGPGDILELVLGQTYTITAKYAVIGWPGSAIPAFEIGGLDSPFTIVSNETRTLNADGTVTIRATFVPTLGPNFPTPRIQLKAGEALPIVGSKLIAGDMLVEVGDTTEPYFDGGTTGVPGYDFGWTVSTNTTISHMYDSDYSVSYTGAADASPAVVTALAPVSVTAPNASQAFRYITTYLPFMGTRADRFLVRTTSPVAITTGTFAVVNGTSYHLTFRARSNTRDLIVGPRIGGTVAPSITLKKGVWTLIDVTLTAGAGGSAQTGLVLTSGAGHAIGDTIDIDTALLSVPEYTGGYFDGSFTDGTLIRFGWTGGAHSSTSTVETRSEIPGSRGNSGGITAVEDYTVRLDATPILATDTSASTPQFNVSIQPGELFDLFRQRGRGIMLSDTEKRGTILGYVDGFSNSPEGLQYSALTPLSKLVGRIELPVYNGTFGDFMSDLLAYVDPTIPLQFGGTIASIPLTLPSMADTAWNILNEVCLVHRIECNVMHGVVTFRPIRGAVFLYDDIVDASHEYTTGPKAKYIEVTNYNTQWVTNAKIWPNNGTASQAEDTVPSLAAGQTLVIDLELGDNVALQSVQQPVAVLDNITPAYSHYVVLDSRNRVIWGQTWADMGGALSVELLNNGTLIRVTVTAPFDRPDLAPWQIGRLDAQGNIVNSLVLYGTGATMTPQVIQIPTGANSTELIEEVGASITLPSVANAAMAYDVAQDVMAEYSVPTQAISGTLTLPELTTISDELASLAPPEVDPGDELAWFSDQLFTVLIGARIRYAYSYFRITNVEFGPDQITFDAVADTVIEDIEEVWGDLTYEQLEAIYGPDLTWEEWEAIPLYLGENGYGTSYYGDGVYGGDTLGA